MGAAFPDGGFVVIQGVFDEDEQAAILDDYSGITRDLYSQHRYSTANFIMFKEGLLQYSQHLPIRVRVIPHMPSQKRSSSGATLPTTNARSLSFFDV